jgi:hypothetical protein
LHQPWRQKSWLWRGVKERKLVVSYGKVYKRQQDVPFHDQCSNVTVRSIALSQLKSEIERKEIILLGKTN